MFFTNKQYDVTIERFDELGSRIDERFGRIGNLDKLDDVESLLKEILEELKKMNASSERDGGNTDRR